MVQQKWLKNLSEQEQLELLKARHERDQQRAREYARKNKLRTAARKYGVSVEELQTIIDLADGKCGICSDQVGERLNIDHCEDSGRVRDLLCTPCNTGLGLFKHDVDKLEEAARYLRYHEQLCEEDKNGRYTARSESA